MASPCIRKCADEINRLIALGIPVFTPQGNEIQEARIPVLRRKNHKVNLSLILKTGKYQTHRLGRRTSSWEKRAAWVVGEPTEIACYTENDKVKMLVARPKAYFPDNFTEIPKGKMEITCPVSLDFNGGIFVDGTWVRGYSCRNHPPVGHKLYSSWGCNPGSNEMRFKILPK